jgi:hypothetical protein
MNILQIRKMAKNLGIKTYRKKKADIIREIQIKEGNFPCFGTAKDWCDQINCLWRSDCLK